MALSETDTCRTHVTGGAAWQPYTERATGTESDTSGGASGSPIGRESGRTKREWLAGPRPSAWPSG
jgi:hypothetical protein